MKVVFIVSRFPYPLEKGDKLRAFQHLVNLYEAGWEVYLVALSDIRVEERYIEKIKPYCKEISVLRLNPLRLFINLSLSFFRKLPLQVGYFYSVTHRNRISKYFNTVKPDVIYCQLIRTVLLADKSGDTPKAIDYQDAFSHGTKQRMLKAPSVLKWLFKREYRLVSNFEKNSYDKFDEHFIISGQDKGWLQVENGKQVTILANGVNTSFFTPVQTEKNFDITFVGNMNYPPNIDGVQFLVNEIMPHVWKVFPDARVQIGGANPHQKVKELAGDKVTVTGWVEDIRNCYSRSKVFIAPMRIGTGLQNKLLEAMAMGIPCVTTPLSLEPLGASEGNEILVGETTAGLGDHLIGLLKDESKRENIGIAGRDFVIRNYSISHSRTVLNDHLTKLVSNS